MMLLYEIFNLREDASACSTTSGSIAPVATSLGAVQRRMPDSMFVGKYTTDTNPTPNTPDEYKKYKRKK
jgi:hypothetical protein